MPCWWSYRDHSSHTAVIGSYSAGCRKVMAVVVGADPAAGWGGVEGVQENSSMLLPIKKDRMGGGIK